MILARGPLRRTGVIATILVALTLCLSVAGTSSADGDGAARELVNALVGGSPILDVRARIEVAKIDGLDQSEAYTVRTRVGYRTKPFHGLSGQAELENIAAINSSQYFDLTTPANGKSVIADPTATEVNQAFVRYEREAVLNGSIKVGRQRIILDDARFIGNVGWRQNEQTYDAAQLVTSLGVDGLQITYDYVWEVRRIFGDAGLMPHWKSDSHLVNASYSDLPVIDKLTVFTYVMDFRDSSAPNSNVTAGLRATGQVNISDDWKIAYMGSYAYQTDHAKNATNYDVNFFVADAKLVHAPLGAAGVRFEYLGSDGGDAQFVTPLATGHAFLGWADAYLDNGGADGIQDLSVYVAPKLPMKLTGKLVYHHFWSAKGSNSEADEVDIILNRKWNEHVTVTTKFAYFDTTSSSAPADRWRFWLQMELKL